MARRHGTRSMYTAGCRCGECAEANRSAARYRERMIAYGQWEPYVDARPARNHLRVLAARGIGWRRAADLAGLSRSTVSKVLYGTPSTPPARRVRPETASAVLSVRVSLLSLAPGSVIDGSGTRRRLQALVACGWTQHALAGRLGMTDANLSSVMRRDQVTAGKAAAVAGLYEELWDQAPPGGAASGRARLAASRRGWAPPAAWDDDEIDDPEGEPPAGWQRPSRLSRGALAAEAADLARMGAGREEAVARLGVSAQAIARALAEGAGEDGEAAA